jgi:hypothetical protein
MAAALAISPSVIPAKAGIQLLFGNRFQGKSGIPAFAGMTREG